MKKGISTVIVLLVICSVFLYVRNAGGRNTAEEMVVQEEVPEKEQEPEEIAEVEYVEAINMPHNYNLKQEDIDRIGQCRHLKNWQYIFGMTNWICLRSAI